ncbi:MAG: extracellular solute-binding protein [Chromatiales bacterium]|nr:extracellular solute-binding protein [Chromatiales bacterium]
MRHAVLPALLLALLAGCAPAPDDNGERIVVYSSRVEQLIQPIFEAWTRETGVGIDFITADDQPLIQRLQAEGASSPADLLLTVDAGNLWNAAERGLLRPLESEILDSRIPATLRDPAGHWFGLSIRTRTIIYAPDRVDPATLDSYEALAEPQWRGRLCLRTSKKVYNQSLVAMLIEQHGEPRAEEIVRGWVANLATDVLPNDNQVIEAVAAGRCDVGIVNSYYFGRLVAQRPDLNARLFWPNQQAADGTRGSGVHVNVSGAGVTRHAPRAALAQQFIEWLTSPAAQELFAGLNYEYPVNPDVPLDPLVASWGTFSQSQVNVARLGERQAAAVMLMDRAGYR